MTYKVERLANKLTSIISSWPGVESVVSCEASDTDVIDPYFALVLDVYCYGSIPAGEERHTFFDNPGAFETSKSGEKDRFFIDELPIHLEYKRTRTIEDLVTKSLDAIWMFGTTGTYMIYRLVHGKTLFAKSDWLDRMRGFLAESPSEFWDSLLETYQQKIEHSLSDLGGAALKDDKFFYFVSLAGFIRSCSSALFALNKQWEPSDRHMTTALMSLPVLPDDFDGLWSTLMRTDGSIDPGRRYQIAQLIARSVFALL
jgi:hypothetical protein